jgi:ectoine hydroxylase-related dioxygenase (phytanoyl-CoA dioxygenase family)
MSDTASSVRPHPLNTGFTWEDRPGSPSTLSTAQVRHFDEQGFVVVPDVVDTDVLAQVVAETDRCEARTDAFLRGQEGGRMAIAETGAITFSTHLVARSDVLRSLSCHPTILGICSDLIGPDVSLYWDQAVYKKPEKPRRFPWHQDNGYAYVEPQQYLTVWLALTDATVENGCPVVAPGFHRMGTLEHRYVEPLGFECLSDPDGAIAAPVAAGGAVVFSSLTPHLTGPNTTSSVRKAYILQYAPTGAVVVREGGMREPADAPDRQYPVLRDGHPAA